MPQAVRSVLAVLAGVVVAFGLVAVIEAAGHAVYPVPKDLDFANKERVRTYMQALPLGALLFVLVAWIVAAFGGGAVAALIARNRPALHAGIVGAFVLAATIANLLMLPHPAWMAVAGIGGICFAAFAAGRVVAARRSR